MAGQLEGSLRAAGGKLEVSWMAGGQLEGSWRAAGGQLEGSPPSMSRPASCAGPRWCKAPTEHVPCQCSSQPAAGSGVTVREALLGATALITGGNS